MKARGVYFCQSKERWIAVLNGYLGTFKSFEEAYACRQAAEIKKYGRLQDKNVIEIMDDYAKVPLFNKKGFIVAYTEIDIEDVKLVENKRWSLTAFGYAATGRNRRMHQLLMNAKPFEEYDHKDRVKLNNRRSNLRKSTHGENGCNLPLQKKSRFKGVFPSLKKWRAQIVHKGKSIHLGSFSTEEEAAAAYDKKAIELHGDYAATNKMVRRA